MGRKKSSVEVYNVRVKGHGVVPIKIYRKSKYWVCEDRSSGRRRLLNCRSHSAAHERAELIADAVARGKQALLAMTRWDVNECEMARRTVEPFAVNILSVCQEWAQARKLLAGKASILDAVKFFLDRGGGGVSPKNFNEAKEAFLQLKAQQNISDHQRRKIRSRLDKFAVRFGERPLDSITPGELELFLTGMGFAAKTRNHYRKDLMALYRFAALNRYVAKDCNPAKEFKAATEGFRHIEFFKPEQVKKLLAAAPTGADVLYIVLCGFAGLRPCETTRLDWSMVGDDYLHLPVGICGKGGRPRKVAIQRNLKLWLAAYRRKAGPVLPKDFCLRTKPSELAKLAGVTWINDGLRHSYASFRYSLIQNKDSLSDELGNTREICQRHYVNTLASQADATAWFAVVPDGNVVPMPKQEEAPATPVAV